jgi:hypothetical protein
VLSSRTCLWLLLALLGSGCVTQKAVEAVSAEIHQPQRKQLVAIGRFPIGGDRVVQLVASDFRCVAKIVNDGGHEVPPGEPEPASVPGRLGCTLERVPRDRFPEALLPGDEVLAAYAAQQVIPSAVVLVRDWRGRPVFVTREPSGAWTQHELSTFEAPSDPVARKVFLAIGGGVVVLGAVLVDAALFPAYLGYAAGLGLDHAGAPALFPYGVVGFHPKSPPGN